jgi:hypothetical protein
MSSSHLPEHPKVIIDGTAIVIHNENGEKEVWGYESDRIIAEDIAQKIEIGLRAINYVALEIMKSLSDIADELETLGVLSEHINDHICEEYNRVSKWFREIDTKKAIPEF